MSTVVGVALLVGIVLIVSVGAVLLGTAALEQRRGTASVESATVAMNEVDAAVSSATRTGEAGGTTTVDLGRLGRDTTVSDDGSITVVVDDAGTPGTEYAVTRQLGKVVYARGAHRVAYQGGGVWRRTASSNESVMVSPPNFRYVHEGGRPTLSLPVVTLAPEGEAGSGRLAVSRTGTSERLVPAGSSVANPIDGRYEVTVRVHSEYYRAWGEFFAAETNGTVTYDHAGDDVAVTLYGSGSGGAGGGSVGATILTQSGTAITNLGRIDSYDSETGPYPGWRHGERARIAVEDDFTLSSTPQISGNLTVAGRLFTANDPTVYGRTVTGGTPGPGAGPTDEIRNDAAFHGVFSTKDDLIVKWGSGATFGDALIVGGSIEEFGPAAVEGPIHVGGDARLDEGGGPNVIEGDVIASGDVRLDDNLQFQGSDRTVISDGAVRIEGGTHDVDVIAAGNVRIDSGATVDGDVDAGGDAFVQGTVTGTVTAGGNVVPYTAMEPGWQAHGSPTPPPMDRRRSPIEPTVSMPAPVDGAITENGSEIRANDDDGPAVPKIEAWDGCDPGCTLTAGQYDLDRIDHRAPGESLRIDTTGGDVKLYVENEIRIGRPITVTGENDVRIYANGNLHVEGDDAVVTTPNDDASQLWVYMREGSEASFASGSPSFTGVVYGPGTTDDQSVEVTLTNDATVYGAVVGNITKYSSSAEIHYDASLADATAGAAPGPTGARVAYLRVTSREVTVEG